MHSGKVLLAHSHWPPSWLKRLRCICLGLLESGFTYVYVQLYLRMAESEPFAGNYITTTRQNGLSGLSARPPELSSQSYEETAKKTLLFPALLLPFCRPLPSCFSRSHYYTGIGRYLVCPIMVAWVRTYSPLTLAPSCS